MKFQKPIFPGALALALLGGAMIGTPRVAQAQGKLPPAFGTGQSQPTSQVQQQIALIMKDKATWKGGLRKLSSELIYAGRMAHRQPAVPGLAISPKIDLPQDMLGRVKVNIHATLSPNLLQAVQGMGGTVVVAHPRYSSLQVWIGLDWLPVLAERPDVRTIRKALDPIVRTGSVNTQGDVAHGTGAVRNAFGATGTGTKIGVISDSNGAMAAAVASADLPNTVEVLSDAVAATSEGTAMLEILHDLVPDAALAFATGAPDKATFAQAILDLAAAGCDILVDDLGYPDEYAFQDDIIAQAVDTVVANGAVLFSAAGNDRGTVWEGDFNNGGPGTGLFASAGDVHLFPNGTIFNRVNTTTSGTLTLQWSDPGLASTNDYDLYVVNAAGTALVSWSSNIQDGTQDPFEAVAGATNGTQAVVAKFESTHLDRALRLSFVGTGSLAQQTSGEVYGHAAASLGIAVAALPSANVDYSLVGLRITENTSSRSPRRIFYYSDGTPVTPDNFLFATDGGETRDSVTMAAANRVATKTIPTFNGTSASAPHAAGIWSQLKSLNYFSSTPTEISSVFGPALQRDELGLALIMAALDADLPGFDESSGFGVPSAIASANSLVHLINGPTISVSGVDVKLDWLTALPADTIVDIYTQPNDPDAIHIEDFNYDFLHSASVTNLKENTVYQYEVSSGTASGSVLNTRIGTFTTARAIEIVATRAVLIGFNTNSWKLQVTFENKTNAAATNVKVEGLVLKSTSTVTKLPAAILDIPAGGSVTHTFNFTRLRVLGVLKARVAGSYTAGRGPRRFTGELFVEIQ